jgi:hypothetical protein
MDRLFLLIHEREIFENDLYNTLVTPLIIPEDFWEPVIVCLTDEQIEEMQNITKEEMCFICNEITKDFKILKCCNKDMCIDCTYNWFNRSVYCPFCKFDQRTLFKE